MSCGWVCQVLRDGCLHCGGVLVSAGCLSGRCLGVLGDHLVGLVVKYVCGHVRLGLWLGKLLRMMRWVWLGYGVLCWVLLGESGVSGFWWRYSERSGVG